MTAQTKKIALATIAVVTFFAVYETVKTVVFPAMGVVTSHIISTIVVGVTTVIIARYVFRQQVSLLYEQEQTTRRLQDALGKSELDENLLRSIVASVAEGLVITGRDSNVLIINDAARELLNIGQRPVIRLTNLSREPQLHRVFASVLAGGERVEARIETRSSEAGSQNRRILRLHAAPLRLSDRQVDGVVCAFIDETKLDMLERVRQEFLSNVSHELRTPLAAITAYAETLLDGGVDDPDNSLRFLHTIQRNAERMKALVNDISELSAIESGAVSLAIERLPLRQVVGDVFIGLTHRAAQYGVTLHNQVIEDFYVEADRRRLDQILINLVDNAIKFNHPGGAVTVIAEASEEGQIIKVRDTGPGIPPEHLPRVFERFYRVDKARSREAGGTGLGLAIVKHLALAHGGEANVTSEVGVGSEFAIKLPQRRAVVLSRIKINPLQRLSAMRQNTDSTPSGASGFDFSVKVKRIHPGAKLPMRATNGSAGADLVCLEAFTLGSGERKLVPTGLIVEIPPGWYGRVAPRSGLAAKHGVDMLAGVIDSDYRAEVKALMINLGDAPVSFEAGDRIAQLIIERAAVCDYLWTDELSETERGDGGFGSTG